MDLMAKVLTVSDSAYAGVRPDGSGPALRTYLEGHGFVVPMVEVVPDGLVPVSEALCRLADRFCGLLVTTGGTGFAPTDSTPEATRSVLERQAPGLAEAIRSSNPLGPLSRGVAGTRGECLIVNLPGSVSGALESMGSVIEVIPHALELLSGGRPH